jgi:hypothetical protein
VLFEVSWTVFEGRWSIVDGQCGPILKHQSQVFNTMKNDLHHKTGELGVTMPATPSSSVFDEPDADTGRVEEYITTRITQKQRVYYMDLRCKWI